MTMPTECDLASKELEAFLTGIMPNSDAPTHLRACCSKRAVRHAFRDHLCQSSKVETLLHNRSR